MRKPGEFDLFRFLYGVGPTSFFWDSHARFPTLEAINDHQRKKKTQEEQGKLACQVWYVLKIFFNKYPLTSHRSRSVIMPMSLPPT